MTGIYCIENKENGLAYIGQAVDIKRRWAQHRSDLRAQRHDNEHLQRAWNKYGESAFKFYVVEETEKEYLNAAEMMWIEYFDTFQNGYNMTLGGDATRGLIPWDKGLHRSEKVRSALSESAKKRTGEKNAFYGRRHSDATKQKISEYRSMPVVDTETGVIYSSAKYADAMFNGHSSNVSKALNGKTSTAYGIKWDYLKTQ